MPLLNLRIKPPLLVVIVIIEVRTLAFAATIDSIIHGLETREITEFHARFDFRKLYSLLNVYRCYSECTFLCIGGRRITRPSLLVNADSLFTVLSLSFRVLSGQAQTKFTWHWRSHNSRSCNRNDRLNVDKPTEQL